MQSKKFSPKVIGLLAAIVTFAALSVLAGGFIEVSKDLGLGLWLWETALYAVTNKALEKLLLSVGVGVVTAFVASMIQYGKQVKAHRVVRRTQVRFTQAPSTEETRQAG